METSREIERAHQFLTEMRARTTDEPGITRASYGEGEQIAHAMVRAWAQALDLEIANDFAGNLYMTLPGRDRLRPVLMMGSHMDSVPHGGNYDGAAGVVAGMAAVERLRRLGIPPAMDVVVMAIRAEELSWFPAPYIGSRAAFGRLAGDHVDKVVRFDTGRSLGSHLTELGFDPEAVRAGRRHLDPARIGAYIEVHIEQGPHLVAIERPCAIVTGIRGNFRFKHARAIGEYGHAGAVPRTQRQDALLAAVEFAHGMERMWIRREAEGQDLVCTVGEFFTDPEQHTMTKIPGEVRFTLDIRSYDEAVLAQCRVELERAAEEISRTRRVRIELGTHTHARSAVMDANLIALAERAAARLGIDAPRMASGAGHDCAVFANEGVPCAMLFIRNEDGSHNPREKMEIGDFAVASRLLWEMLDELVK
jgi:N-carbamoyl-L-amino-acid hydrolase